MQISYNWLKDYCEHDLAANELSKELSHAGLCVETCEPRNGDWMLDVEVTSNRPDCLSHLGLAREVAAITGKKVVAPSVSAVETGEADFENLAEVTVQDSGLCPHYTARIIRNLKVGPSPQWMQERLKTCGLRPVNNIVDITNYVLLESGQPMHAFDFRSVRDGRIVVRRAAKGEKITTIDGTECELSENMCVIADGAGAVAVAGIMGGLNTEISENTTCVLLESARFNPVNIRRTSRTLGLNSDSSYRFERGVDPENVEAASLRAAGLIAQFAGGEPVRGRADIRADSSSTPEVTMRTGRLLKVLGISVDKERIMAIFEGLGLRIIDNDSDSIKVAVPPHRPDLKREIDLIEEVARIHGYDRIPETTRIPVAVAPLSKREICERKVKKLVAGHGFNEIMTCSLVSPRAPQLIQPWHEGEPIALRNPVSTDKTHLRLTLIGNLLDAKCYNNARKIASVDLFEAGKIYLPTAKNPEGRPEEKRCLSMLTDRRDGFFVLKGILQNICSALYLPENITTESPEHSEVFADEKSLQFFLEGRLLGYLGEINGGWAGDMDFQTAPSVMELDMDLLFDHASIEPTLIPLPKYPAVKRDIAVVVDEAVRWADIESCVRKSGGKHMESIDFFDIYRGKQIRSGKKSIAFSLTFRADVRTLKNEEADRFRDAIANALAEKLGAHLRT